MTDNFSEIIDYTDPVQVLKVLEKNNYVPFMRMLGAAELVSGNVPVIFINKVLFEQAREEGIQTNEIIMVDKYAEKCITYVLPIKTAMEIVLSRYQV